MEREAAQAPGGFFIAIEWLSAVENRCKFVPNWIVNNRFQKKARQREFWNLCK
jgi:hypothetical protein